MLVGRVWRHRPTMARQSVTIRDGQRLVDITAAESSPTVSAVFERDDPVAWVRDAPGENIGSIEEVFANGSEVMRDADEPYLLAPIDLQADQGRGRDLYRQPAGTRDRGACARICGSRGRRYARIWKRSLGADLAAVEPGSVQTGAGR